MGLRIRDFAWTATALGPPSAWPQSLRVAVGLVLGAKLPMAVWWGDDLIFFYNDSYRDLMEVGRHPNALGTLARYRTDALWDMVEPGFQSVMDGGGALSGTDTPVMSGTSEKPMYWDYDICPIDMDGKVGGILGIVKDVTADHEDDERLNQTSATLLNMYESTPGFICIFSGPKHVYEFVNYDYRALMGERNYIGRPVREVVPEVEGQGFFELLDNVYQTGKTFVGKELPMRYRPDGSSAMVEVTVDLVYKALISPTGEVYGIFVDGMHHDPGSSDRDRPQVDRILTEREREVLGWVALGKTAAEMAIIMGLSKRTCETHVYSAARKLDTVNSTQTVVEAIRRGELKL